MDFSTLVISQKYKIKTPVLKNENLLKCKKFKVHKHTKNYKISQNMHLLQPLFRLSVGIKMKNTPMGKQTALNTNMYK